MSLESIHLGMTLRRISDNFKCFTEFYTENGLCWEAVDTDQLPLSGFFRLYFFLTQVSERLLFLNILVYILFSLY